MASDVTDLVGRLRKGRLVKASEPMNIGEHGIAWSGEVRECHPDALEAATTLETLTQENKRLRGLIDTSDPAWEDARGALVTELRKAGMDTHADNVAAGHEVQIWSWVSLNLIAHSRKTLTQENARLREAGWRDIESAPKDGAEIVGHDSATGVSHVTEWTGSSWYDPDNHYYSESRPFQPTHWMPLPPAPARKALGGGDE